jgi:hypothetical protein
MGLFVFTTYRERVVVEKHESKTKHLGKNQNLPHYLIGLSTFTSLLENLNGVNSPSLGAV